jgi:hypothetical protein
MTKKKEYHAMRSKSSLVNLLLWQEGSKCYTTQNNVFIALYSSVEHVRKSLAMRMMLSVSKSSIPEVVIGGPDRFFPSGLNSLTSRGQSTVALPRRIVGCRSYYEANHVM